MDEEESRKSTRNRKKRTFGDDFIDPTTPEFSAKPGGSTKRKKEDSQSTDVDFKPSPSPPSRGPPEKESDEVVDNISKILARYKKQEEREELEMKRIEQNLFGESSRRDSELKNQRKLVEKEQEEEEIDDEEMEESDEELCDDPDDKNYRPSRQRRKKRPLTMSGLHQILNKFERPKTPPPAPPTPSVSFSYSAQLTPEEEAKLDEEASALIASIREASTLKILAKRQNGKTAFGEEKEAEDAEISEFMKTAEPGMVQKISRSLSEDSGSSSPPTAARRSARKQVAKTRGYSPEPDGGGGGRRKSTTVTRKPSAEKNPEVEDPILEEPDYDVPSTSDLFVEQTLEPKYEAPESPDAFPSTSTATDLDYEASPIENLPEAPPTSELQSCIGNLLEEPKPEPISAAEEPQELKPEALIEETSEGVSSVEGTLEVKPEILLAPPPEEESTVIQDPKYMDEAPECAYSPRHSPIPPPTKSKVLPNPRKYPPGCTIETITIVKGPDGRILSKKKVISKLVAKVKKTTEVPEVQIRSQQQNQTQRVPRVEDVRMREEPTVFEPEVRERDDGIRRRRYPFPMHQQPIAGFSMPGPSTSSSSSYQLPSKVFKSTIQKHLTKRLSPKRLFLGAEEPLKDLPTTSSSQNRWFTKRIVKSFGRDQLRPFGVKPPVNVFGKEVPDPVEDDKEDRITMERVQDLLVVKKAREEEQMRQKKAMAKKLIFNEAHIYNYMNSEKFKESLESKTSGSEFNKILNSPVPLQKVPEFSDSLFHTNRNLYENLERIRDLRLHQGYPKRVYRKDFQDRWNEDNTVDYGELEWPEEAPEKEPEPNTGREQAWIEVLEEINQRWNGIASKIPTTIECHLCQADMRLILRRTKTGGVAREYPVYRCSQKRCQTFRSIRKALDISGIRGQPPLNQDPFESPFPMDDFVMNEPKLEPIEQILQDVIRRQQEVSGEILEESSKDSDCQGDAMVPMGHKKNIRSGSLDFESTSGNPVDPMEE